jgi:hypothetical protein
MCVLQQVLHISKPVLSDLNDVIASHVTAALAPSSAHYSAAAQSSTGCSLAQKLQHLCPNRDFMYIMASTVPQMPTASLAFASGELLTLLLHH